MNVTIIGNGAWGKAMYHLLRYNCNSVTIAKRNEIINNADMVVLCVPTQSIRDAVKNICFTGKSKIVINTAKGIERLTHKLPYQIIHEVLTKDIQYYSLIGPSFAEEVIKNMPTIVNIGYISKHTNDSVVKKLFQTDWFRVKLTKGAEILELSAALKNIYAISCGLADGLGYRTNTRVKLIVLAINELQQLFKNLNLSVSEDITPGTVGDLILTCNSSESRNYRFGKYLVYYDSDIALKKINATVEGYYSLETIPYLENLSKMKLRLARLVQNIVSEKDAGVRKHYFEEYVKET